MEHIAELDLSDNRLGDIATAALVHAAKRMPRLERIDLSLNDLDDLSADAVRGLLGRSECKIKHLIMQSADLDDSEVSRVMGFRMSLLRVASRIPA